MSITRLFSILMVGLLLIVACTPQARIQPTAIPLLAATASSSLVPTVAVTASSTLIPNPFAGDKAWIAYQTNKAGESIWLIHPDGKKIVMTSRDTGGTEPLYEYDLVTDTYKQLFTCEDPCVGDDEPVYSPDGTKVAFIRALAPFVHSDAANDDVPSDCGIWIGDVVTGKVTQITSNQKCDREYNPRWSPDGSQLVYWRDPYSNGEPTGTSIYTINTDGTNEHQLTKPGDDYGEADWSPDGQWIVFDTHPLAEFNFVPERSNLYRMHPDGSGMEQLTHYQNADLRAIQPQYTPDGKWIIFTAVMPSSRSLWMIPAEGGEPIVIASRGIHTHGHGSHSLMSLNTALYQLRGCIFFRNLTSMPASCKLFTWILTSIFIGMRCVFRPIRW